MTSIQRQQRLARFNRQLVDLVAGLPPALRADAAPIVERVLRAIRPERAEQTVLPLDEPEDYDYAT